MIKWLSRLTLLLIFAFFFLIPKTTFAANRYYLVTQGIPWKFIDDNTFIDDKATFYKTDLEIDYQGGEIILNGNTEGTGKHLVDDALRIFITHQDGSTSWTYYTYDNHCWWLEEENPMDLTYYFKPGINKVHVELYDHCSAGIGSLPLYFVNTNAPESPPSKTPLIFIPGIGGSEFKTKDNIYWIDKSDGHGGTYSHIYPAGEKVWVNEGEIKMPGNDDYFDLLRLKTDGQTPEADLELITDSIYSGSYQNTLNFFTSNGYTIGQDLFVFPYDWRKDLLQTADQLDQKIENIKQARNVQDVDIVAHSMGGLVARNYIADAGRATKVRKLITLGTPYLGSVKFLKALINGECLTREELNHLPICLGLSPSEVKDLVQNMPGAFQLAPSQLYFNFYNNQDYLHPYPLIDNMDTDGNGIKGPLNYLQIKNFLTNLNYNTSLFVPTENFHNSDNLLPNTNGVDVTIVAGSGQSTLGQIIEGNKLDLEETETIYYDQRKINGDGTVPLLSASISDSHRNLSLAGDAHVYYTNQDHGSLVENGAALSLVKNILAGVTETPSGVSTEPFNLFGHWFSVHSPVNIHIYDEQGNHTGPLANGHFEENIPGSTYETLEDSKYIWIPSNGKYTVKFEATDEGSFDFKIRNFVDDINNRTIFYKDTPLTINTKGETVYDTSDSNIPVLQMDNDGNGSVDNQVQVTSILNQEGSYDQTAPQTSIKLDGVKDENNIYKGDVVVTLEASDESSGSGILKTEYTLDDGQTVNVYDKPFIITKEGLNKLRVKSSDKAGNEEAPHEAEIRIDKTPPTKLQTVKYQWGQPSPGYSSAKWPIFESWMQVFMHNMGTVDAYNVKATISSTPSNVQIVKGTVNLGNITASQSAWSQDNFQIKTDMAHPADRCAGITWKIEFDDVSGRHYVLPNIPQFPPGQAPGGCP